MKRSPRPHGGGPGLKSRDRSQASAPGVAGLTVAIRAKNYLKVNDGRMTTHMKTAAGRGSDRLSHHD